MRHDAISWENRIRIYILMRHYTNMVFSLKALYCADFLTRGLLYLWRDDCNKNEILCRLVLILRQCYVLLRYKAKCVTLHATRQQSIARK